MPDSSFPLMHPANHDLPTVFRALKAGRIEGEQNFLEWLADYVEKKGIPKGISLHSFETDMESQDPADFWKRDVEDDE